VSFSLTILGSSSAIPTSQRFPTAHLLNAGERFFLIDCGEGTQIQLRRFRIRFGRINHIFISHLHGDHVFGLFGLLSSLSLMGRKTDLHIFSPPQLEPILESHLNTFGHERPFAIIYHPLTGSKPKRIFDDPKISVDTIPLKHSTPCYGFLFREKEKLRNIRKEVIRFYNIPVKEIMPIKQGNDFVQTDGTVIPSEVLTYAPPPVRSYAYCTDTKILPKISSQIAGVDLLYHEATFLQKDEALAKKTLHSTAGQAAQLALDAGVKNLILGHFSVRYKKVQPFAEEAAVHYPEVHLARDGDVYAIEPGGLAYLKLLQPEQENENGSTNPDP
jgi:ribonuclease Z